MTIFAGIGNCSHAFLVSRIEQRWLGIKDHFNVVVTTSLGCHMQTGSLLVVQIVQIGSLINEDLQRAWAFAGSSIVDWSSQLHIRHIEFIGDIQQLFQYILVRVDASTMEWSQVVIGVALLSHTGFHEFSKGILIRI